MHEPTHANLHRPLVEWFPELAGIKFTHNWVVQQVYRAIGCAPVPIRAFGSNITATSNLDGRLMAGLITGQQTGLDSSPCAQAIAKLGMGAAAMACGQVYTNIDLRIDKDLEERCSQPWDASVAEYLLRH
jgi:hypothetical protein